MNKESDLKGGMAESRPLARLGELRTPKHLVNCIHYYASTPTIELFQTVTSAEEYGKTSPTLGALLFAGQKTTTYYACTKIRTDILLADPVCFQVQCLPRSAHLKKSS